LISSSVGSATQITRCNGNSTIYQNRFTVTENGITRCIEFDRQGDIAIKGKSFASINLDIIVGIISNAIKVTAAVDEYLPFGFDTVAIEVVINNGGNSLRISDQLCWCAERNRSINWIG
jgi:hypothetical protein